jgi:hypothetical protein
MNVILPIVIQLMSRRRKVLLAFWSLAMGQWLDTRLCIPRSRVRVKLLPLVLREITAKIITFHLAIGSSTVEGQSPLYPNVKGLSKATATGNRREKMAKSFSWLHNSYDTTLGWSSKERSARVGAPDARRAGLTCKKTYGM